LIQSIGKPVFLLGHSYGAQVALKAALTISSCVRKLVLYEPPSPNAVDSTSLTRLEAIAATGDWNSFADAFFKEVLRLSGDEVDELRAS
jgi:pimeloyl-ACP methyl ester carboxylesterase